MEAKTEILRETVRIRRLTYFELSPVARFTRYPDCLRYSKSDIFFCKISGQLETKLGIGFSGEVPYKLNITFVDLKLKVALIIEDGTRMALRNIYWLDMCTSTFSGNTCSSRQISLYILCKTKFVKNLYKDHFLINFTEIFDHKRKIFPMFFVIIFLEFFLSSFSTFHDSQSWNFEVQK